MFCNTVQQFNTGPVRFMNSHIFLDKTLTKFKVYWILSWNIIFITALQLKFERSVTYGFNNK